MENNHKKERLFSTAVVVAALGYFVDIFCPFWRFSVVF
jgi:hypothetical protein